LLGSGFQRRTFPLLCVQNCPRSQVPASHSKSSQRLYRSCPLTHSLLNKLIQSSSYVTTYGQWASLFWCQPIIWGTRPVRQLRLCWCGAPSLTRGRVCHIQLLLVLASAVVLLAPSRPLTIFLFFPWLRRVLKWSFLFEERRGRTSTGYSPSTGEWLRSLSLTHSLHRLVSRSLCVGIKHPSGPYDQIFITVRQLRLCWCGALSLTRGWACRLQLLLVIASAVILGSRVPWDSIPYFTVSDSRLPLSSPTTRSAAVKVFDPASTRDSTCELTGLAYNISARTA
jgi:hypothetical protein